METNQIRSETCPICDGSTTARPATISPFLVERCGLETTETSIRYCAACDFAFFDRRLTVDEAAALYHDYRGEDYNRQRLRLEPSYAPYIPMFADPLSDYYRGRIRDLTDVFAALPEFRPASVLDFGGNGSLAARLFPGAEISHLDASAGVALKRDRFDLIIASQVFEHLTDPRADVARLAELIEEDGLLLLDVPREYPGSLSEGLLWQERYGGSLTVMHEHINHFSTRAIRCLLGTAALVPVFEGDTPYVPLPLILTIAGRHDSALVSRLMKIAPERRLQWSADGIRASQADNRIAQAGRLAAAEAGQAAAKVALAAAETGLAAAKAELATAETGLATAKAELVAIRASRSWRVSAPLRWVSRLLRGH
jgi:SAM-dependent methyltransferase